MKKFLQGLMVLGILSVVDVAARDCSRDCAETDDINGHTFFSGRPNFQEALPEKRALFRTNEMNRRTSGCGWGPSAEVVVYGGMSTDSKDLARFFFPWNKTCLVVREQGLQDVDGLVGIVPPDQDLDPAKDLEARNFNISTVNGNFESVIAIRPEQSKVGIGFDFMQPLWRDEDGQMLMYLDVGFPVERVSNSMNLCETISNDGGGSDGLTGLDGATHVASMVEAFRQANWLYGKIDNRRCMTKWGVADVEIELGFRAYQSDTAYLTTYVGFVAPTGTKIDRKNAAYVFNPVIGNNNHWGFLFGSYHHFDVWQCGDHKVRMSWQVGSRILVANNQVRSFALKDKQYSQYLELYSTSTQAAAAEAAVLAEDIAGAANIGTSGINLLTHCVKVNPRYSVDLNAAFYYEHACGFMGEVGYNVYARHGEHIKLCNWDASSAVKNLTGMGQTSLARTIRKNFDASAIAFDEYDDSVITLADLDLASAAHPAFVSSLVYGALGYQLNDACTFPMAFSVGGSYEFSSVNAIIDRWTVWGKWSINF